MQNYEQVMRTLARSDREDRRLAADLVRYLVSDRRKSRRLVRGARPIIIRYRIVAKRKRSQLQQKLERWQEESLNVRRLLRGFKHGKASKNENKMNARLQHAAFGIVVKCNRLDQQIIRRQKLQNQNLSLKTQATGSRDKRRVQNTWRWWNAQCPKNNLAQHRNGAISITYRKCNLPV